MVSNSFPSLLSASAPEARRLQVGSLMRFVVVVCVVAVVSGLLLALLLNIYQRKQEAKNPWLQIVRVDSDTTDPAPWGKNFPREFDGYNRTMEATRTAFGGSDEDPVQKSRTFPFLTRMFAGYAFSLDYHDRRGHAHMLMDQERTRRVTDVPQKGSCLNCHSSVVPTYRRLGGGDIQKGFEVMCSLSYQDALEQVQTTGSMNPTLEGSQQVLSHVDGAHPVSCVDCHDPATMQLRVNRPAFISAIRALKLHEGIKDFDVNRDASRQEMRTYVCAQCHVNYYCGPKVTLFIPWNNGLKVEEIASYYDAFKFPDGHRFYDWNHAETGAELIKAKHPEFEVWNQGVHAKSGVACADCHMPYQRQGAMKISDHWVRSPLLNVSRSCQVCHRYPEEDLKNRVKSIQDRNFALLQRAGGALVAMLDAMKTLRVPFDVINRPVAESRAMQSLRQDADYARLTSDAQVKKITAVVNSNLNAMWAAHVAAEPSLTAIAELHRQAQWRLDFIAAENSMGFHAPQEAARVLGEAIDYFRQAQLAIERMARTPAALPATMPSLISASAR